MADLDPAWFPVPRSWKFAHDNLTIAGAAIRGHFVRTGGQMLGQHFMRTSLPRPRTGCLPFFVDCVGPESF